MKSIQSYSNLKNKAVPVFVNKAYFSAERHWPEMPGLCCAKPGAEIKKPLIPFRQ
jgi:hypothetical protein